MNIQNSLKNKYKTVIYLVLAMVSGSLIFFCGQPWEYISAIFAGLFFGRILIKKNVPWLVALSLFIVLLVILLDPLLKKILDKMTGVSTVSSLKTSLLVNGLVFVLFWFFFSLSFQLKKKYQ